ncbi:nicotinate-nucleotide adenylyltransferase [Virgibacillus halophilus]|uniref:Probable nicotinate-nucleotide adenylyltransferase n=1 Tax=Tigheibacillus halophilus TaxID=361280 RepID=A0ABU5CE00_9BACI|nr:nicotinate-nucleotide adenylyltransferase [Virgibacillus halophilus]
MKIGILGGTFDPPHMGHLIIAEQVRSQLMLDEVWFIPSNQPPHKREARASVDERLQMVKLAIRNNPAFHMNTIEVKRLGKSYTIETIQTLTKEFTNEHFHFIIGADMVQYLPNWHRIDELIGLIDFVGVKRKGYTLQTPYPVMDVEVPTIEISSTVIRERLKKRESVKYLVPDAVHDFIKEHDIYGSQRS